MVKKIQARYSLKHNKASSLRPQLPCLRVTNLFFVMIKMQKYLYLFFRRVFIPVNCIGVVMLQEQQCGDI